MLCQRPSRLTLVGVYPMLYWCLNSRAMRVVASSSSAAERENLPARRLRDLFEDRLALQIERVAGAAAEFDNPDTIDLDVSFLEQLQFAVGIARGVVLAVGDEQNRPLVVAPLFDLFDPEIGRVVERRLSLRIDERQLSY